MPQPQDEHHARRRGGEKLSYVLLFILLFLLPARSFQHGFHYQDLVIAFRHPSRNTKGFCTGVEKNYVLPQFEFLAALNTSQCSTFAKSLALRPFFHSSTIPFYSIRYGDDIVGPNFTKDLADVSRRCILTYGLFHLLAAGKNPSDTAASACKASNSKGYNHKKGVFSTTIPKYSLSTKLGKRWRVGVVGVSDQNEEILLSSRQKENAVNAFQPFLHGTAGLDPTLRQLDERGPPPELDFFIFIFPKCGQVLLCLRLAQGPGTGKGYTFASKPRRPRSGVLKALAAYREKATFISPTAMDPELAWVMNNMGGVRKRSRVFDPFMGSGSLLFTASLLGAEELFGSDAAQELMGGESRVNKQLIIKSFAYDKNDFSQWVDSLTSPVPVLTQADILSRQLHPLFRSGYYDSIVTDPPYNIKAKVFGKAETATDTKAATARQQTIIPVIFALIDIAASVLVPGGRLVFFLPEWTKQDIGCNKKSDANILSYMLSRTPKAFKVVFTLPQTFSPSFTRWLVCLEKSVNE